LIARLEKGHQKTLEILNDLTTDQWQYGHQLLHMRDFKRVMED